MRRYGNGGRVTLGINLNINPCCFDRSIFTQNRMLNDGGVIKVAEIGGIDAVEPKL